MSLSPDLPNKALSDFLGNIAICPNKGMCEHLLEQFQNAYPEGFPVEQIKLTADLTEHLELAKKRLKRMSEVPPALKELMEKVDAVSRSNLRIDRNVQIHLEINCGPDAFAESKLDLRLQQLRNFTGTVDLGDLETLIGMPNGTVDHNHTFAALILPLETTEKFCTLIESCGSSPDSGIQQVWLDRSLPSCYQQLRRDLDLSKNGKLKAPTASDLEACKASGVPLYLPVGHADHASSFIHLIALDYVGDQLRLRLLTADGDSSLAVADGKDRFCPEVVWNNVSEEKILDQSFWSPLFEPMTWKEWEVLRAPPEIIKKRAAIPSSILIPWLSHELKQIPLSYDLPISKEDWTRAHKNYRKHGRRTETNLSARNAAEPGQRQEVIAKATGMSMRRPNTGYHLHKFLNLIAVDRLENRNDYQLFKAESRLLVLVSALKALQENTVSTFQRGDFLQLMEMGIRGVTAPVEKVLNDNPSEAQSSTAKQLLATLAEWKHRFLQIKETSDKIQLTTARELFPADRKVAKLDMPSKAGRSVQHQAMDAVLLKEQVPPVPRRDVWTEENFPELLSSLQSWYSNLLDASEKCEPVDVVTLAHRNVFSRLPIPDSEDVEAMFPHRLSEGQLMAVLLLLKKISSLVASEVFRDTFVHPTFNVDMARVYRFSFELLRRLNSSVLKMPVSWYCLHQLLRSRHSYHFSDEALADLKALERSFKKISPKGHRAPSEKNKEIPLFFYSWEKFNEDYQWYRRDLGPERLSARSVNEVLNVAELADSLGLKPTDLDRGERAATKWDNSFAGQAVLALEEIAQYHTLAALTSTKVVQKSMDAKRYNLRAVVDYLGPEDHLKIRPREICQWGEHENRFGPKNSPYLAEVYGGKTPVESRMVDISNAEVREPIENLPVTLLREWRPQARLLKALSKKAGQRDYFLHEAASGPRGLSLDVLLEYFEQRPSYLFNRDYRAYFFAVLRSADQLKLAIKNEPAFAKRLSLFCQELIDTDTAALAESRLNVDRLLWTSELLRFALRYAGSESSVIEEQLIQASKTLIKHFESNSTDRIAIAPHLLANDALLKDKTLDLVQRAEMHLLVGASPPSDANAYGVWFEACEAMQAGAEEINTALRSGPAAQRRALWSLILNDPSKVELAMSRSSANLDLSTIAKTNHVVQKQRRYTEHLAEWQKLMESYSSLGGPWRREAVKNKLPQALDELMKNAKDLDAGIAKLRDTSLAAHSFSKTAVLTGFDAHAIYVDWETGRVAGAELSAESMTRIPVHLRRHRDLQILGDLLRAPVEASHNGAHIRFKSHPDLPLSIDLKTGAAWLDHEEESYRLLGQDERARIKLPKSINDKFSVWVSDSSTEQRHGLIVAHREDGSPVPAFTVDSDGKVHPIHGDSSLMLADSGYYPEAEIFARWGLPQSSLLIWLDKDKRASEIHIPLSSGDQPFLRIIREEKRWKIAGLDLYLKETTRSVPAFAGHPVYLVAEDASGSEFLLLPGEDPYKLKKRRNDQDFTPGWNKVLSEGAEEEMHRYRILPSGQVRGLTVADNLMLMLWKIKMGHYEAAAQLAKRWLTPSGRPYSKREQELLLPWLEEDYRHKTVVQERHPAAARIRWYVMVRVWRHLKEHPLVRIQGEKAPKLWERFFVTSGDFGARDLWNTQHMIKGKLLGARLTRKDKRHSNVDKLLIPYDHEALFRLLTKRHCEAPSHPMGHLLDRRVGLGSHDTSNDKTKLSFSTARDGLGELNFWDEDGSGWFENIARSYQQAEQLDRIPVDLLQRQTLLPKCLTFFDRAFNLLRKGPQTEEEKLEYEALTTKLDLLGTEATRHIIFNTFGSMGFQREEWDEEDLLPWLFLQLVHQHIKKQGSKAELPELPSLERRFGLVVEESKINATAFFEKLCALSGKTLKNLVTEYRNGLTVNRAMLLLKQQRPLDEFSTTLKGSIEAAHSGFLIAAIQRWAHLTDKDKTPAQLQLQVELPRWTAAKLPREQSLPADKKDLARLHKDVTQELDRLSKLMKQRESVLLETANKLPEEDENQRLAEIARQMYFVEPRTVDECIGLSLQANPSAWQELCPYASPEDLQLLTVSYLEVALEVQHLQRLEEQLKACMSNPANPDPRKIAEETLRTEHRFLPGTKTLTLMASEYYSNLRLRIAPDQARLINDLSEDVTSEIEQLFGPKHVEGQKLRIGTAAQAIMGSGKSKMLAPLYVHKMLGRGNMPFVCVPNALFGTTLSDLQTMMWDRYKVHVRAFTFDRDSCDKEHLYSVAERLLIAESEPTAFVCRPRDLHALQLMLKERHQLIKDMRERLIHHALNPARQKLPLGVLQAIGDDFVSFDEIYQEFKRNLEQEGWETAMESLPAGIKKKMQRWYDSHLNLEKELSELQEEADLLQSILNFMDKKAALLVDEVAAVWDPRNQLSFPIGWQEQANPLAAEAATRLYFEWLPEFYDALQLNENMQSMSTPEQRREVYRALAKKAWVHYSGLLGDMPDLESFTGYLLSSPDRGMTTKEAVDQWDTSRSLLDRNCAQEIAFLKFCLTSGLEGALTATAFVNYGRSKQDRSLAIAIPYERANLPKENTLFRRPWKTVLMTSQLYAQRWADPEQTLELIQYLQGCDPESKEVKLLEAAKTVWGRKHLDADPNNSKALQELAKDLDAARLDSDKAGAARLLIATYLRRCVFPTQLKLDPAQLTSTPQDLPQITSRTDAMGGTFGFEATWNPHVERRPDESSDRNILDALSEPRNQTCRVLPKGGAQAFLKHIKEGKLGSYMALIDVGALFKGMANEEVARGLFDALPENDAVLFYDDSSGSGAHLAVITAEGKTDLEHSDRASVRQALKRLKVSKPFVFYDQARFIGADHDLPDGKALVTFSKLATKDDVLQGSMRCRKLIDGRHSVDFAVPGEMGGAWDAKRVIKAAKEQQLLLEKKSNFHAICGQMQGYVRWLIDRRMRSILDHEERQKLFNSVSDFLLERQENDLVAAFNNLAGEVNTKEALAKLAKQLTGFVGTVLPNMQEKAKQDLDALLAWHEKRGTELPKTVREGEEMDGATQEVDLSKDQDRMRLMEEEYERMLGSRNPKAEAPWTVLNEGKLKRSPLGALSKTKGVPALYSLSEAVKERGFGKPFSKRIWISRNLLSTFKGDPNCLLTENQKPVHRCLLVQGEDPKLILVSEGDARQLKKLLRKSKGATAQSCCLIEPNGAINQRGSKKQSLENVWHTGDIKLRCLLLQAMVFQGSALALEKIPQDELTEAMLAWTRGKQEPLAGIRSVFETALNYRQDDLSIYQRSRKLKELFRLQKTAVTNNKTKKIEGIAK